MQRVNVVYIVQEVLRENVHRVKFAIMKCKYEQYICCISCVGFYGYCSSHISFLSVQYEFEHSLTCDARNVDPPTASPGSPSRSPIQKGPTQIPTDMPIEPPDPLPFPSTNPKDHMFCGVGLDDANSRCEIPCPTAKECPSGESKLCLNELFKLRRCILISN